jgi:hypothetical protein
LKTVTLMAKVLKNGKVKLKNITTSISIEETSCRVKSMASEYLSGQMVVTTLESS